jgi:adenylate kinase family enzyme
LPNAPRCSARALYGDRVPLLGPDDPLPFRPQRVLIAGTSGAGKSVFARRLGAALDLPYVEIDALFHGPNWTPRESFEREVDDFSENPRWTTEWQYDAVRQLLADRCDLVVWLDLPRHVVMRQVIRRTLHRRKTRAVIWNGNIEPPLRTIFADPEHVIRWAWTSHSENARRIMALAQSHPNLSIVRLRSHDEGDRWRANLRTETASDY